MKLLTKSIETKLLKNGALGVIFENFDPKPVVKLFTPDGGATWLLTELDEHNVAFGLCDLGFGSPELGYVDLTELAAARGKLGPIERDRYFKPNGPLSEYTAKASDCGRIVA